MTQAYNFSAGPAMLPKEVLLKIQEELIEYENSKASVMEISHRGVDFMEAAEKSEKDLRELLKIPDHYKLLFLQGGASAQFSMVPINLLRGGSKANYANTGHWSVKAIAEAKRYCEVNVCTDSTENNFTNIDDFQNWDIDEASSYLHYTPNETIAGLEFDYIPDVSMPIAADMSSTILSREIDVSKYGVIYAGAQKNIGPSGLTIVIVRDDLIGHAVNGQPSCLIMPLKPIMILCLIHLRRSRGTRLEESLSGLKRRVVSAQCKRLIKQKQSLYIVQLIIQIFILTQSQ